MSNVLSASSIDASTPLQQLQRRLLLIILPLGILALAINWRIDTARDSLLFLDTIAYPLLIVFYSSNVLVVWRFPQRIRAVAIASFSMFIVYTAAYTTLVFSPWRTSDDLYRMATLPQWIPLIYITAFIFFETRPALCISLALFVLLVAPSAVPLIAQGMASLQPLHGHLLLDLCFANAIYITLLAGGAWLKEHYLTTAAQDALLARIAHLDGLTGIANRRAFDQAVRQALTLASQLRHPVAVILLDIDRFKEVNDTFGHAAGDQVLIGVADALRQHLRTNDTVGRWGGEEFLIIAPSTDAAQAQALAERLRAGIAQLCVAQGNPVTASFGIAIGHPADTPESLMKRADTALYQAKHLGRNRVEAAVRLEQRTSESASDGGHQRSEPQKRDP